MMSSVIPARLVFQCGHAALVSLPRIKGETPTQRADRVAREKSSSQTRACDFCAQRLEVVVQQPTSAPPVVLPTAVPIPLATRRPTVVRNGTASIKRLEESAASRGQAAASAPAAPVAAAVTAVPAPPPAPPAQVQPVATIVPAAAAPTVAPPAAIVRKPVGRPRRKATRTRRGTAGERFVVQFQVQTVIRAVDAGDALRQAQSLGAIEVLAIIRENTTRI